MNKAKLIVQLRNSREYKFKTEGLDVEAILKQDCEGLRQGLIDGKFSAVDLVNVFAQRCSTIGRGLCLST